jgi:hypothetical protein
MAAEVLHIVNTYCSARAFHAMGGRQAGRRSRNQARTGVNELSALTAAEQVLTHAVLGPTITREPTVSVLHKEIGSHLAGCVTLTQLHATKYFLRRWSSLSRAFPAFYGTTNFIAILTSARRRIVLPSVRCTHSTFWCSILRPILLLSSSHPPADRPSGVFPSDFQTKMLHAYLKCATCFARLILLHLINPTITDKKYKLCSS